MKRLAIALAISSSLALPFAAHAVEYNQVQTDKSAINFTYKQMGVAVDGKFSRFSSQFNFDPAKPTAAKGLSDAKKPGKPEKVTAAAAAKPEKPVVGNKVIARLDSPPVAKPPPKNPKRGI